MFWSDAIDKDVHLLCDNFECLWVAEENEIFDKHQKITLILTFPVKFDECYCARLFAGGHKTKDLETEYYSGVVEL